MVYYPDIQEWDDLKIFDTMGAIFEAGYETEQEPKEGRSEWTVKYLEILYEKHVELIAESNRRLEIKNK